MGFIDFLAKLKARKQGDLPDNTVRPDGATEAPASVEQQPVMLGTQVAVRPPETMPSQEDFTATQNVGRVMTPLAAPPSAMMSNEPQADQPQMAETPSVMAVSPYTQRRMDADTALYEAQNKDYKGKDRDKDHNWWDVAKTGLLNAGKGFLRGGLGGAIIGGATGAIQGAVDRNADEKFINQNITLPRLAQTAQVAREGEMNALKTDAQDLQNEWYKVRPDFERRKLEQKDSELAIRESTAKYTKLKGEKQQALAPILKRGYYRKGVNEAEDARLESLGIILPDFDSRKRQVKEQAGKFYQQDPDTFKWEEASGIATDQSEVPIEFSVDGQRMMLRPRDVANIKAAQVRQEDQQEFTASENEKKREHDAKQRDAQNRLRIALTQYNAAMQDKRQADAQTYRIQMEQIREEIRQNDAIFKQAIKQK